MARIVVLPFVVLGLAAALLTFDRDDIARFLAGTPEPAVSTASPVPVAREVSLQTDLYSFDYTYPAQAAAIPGLRELLDRKIEEAKARLDAEARESRRDAKANAYPFQPHYFDLGWTVAGDLPAWLSLQAGVQTYGGGAHPNQHFETLVWDRKGARALAPLDMFVSSEALDNALHRRYCDVLDIERAKRREQSVAEVRADEIWQCPGVSDITIVLEARGGRAFDHLLLLAAPYAAGAYVEGSYDTEIAVDAAVLAAVKPEFRTAFSVSR